MLLCQNKHIAQQLEGASLCGIFGQGELGNMSLLYNIDRQQFTDKGDNDIRWHGYGQVVCEPTVSCSGNDACSFDRYTNFFHMFGFSA